MGGEEWRIDGWGEGGGRCWMGGKMESCGGFVMPE